MREENNISSLVAHERRDLRLVFCYCVVCCITNNWRDKGRLHRKVVAATNVKTVKRHTLRVLRGFQF